MIQRLIAKFGYNKPIFTYEILTEMNNYSRPRVFQLLKILEQKGDIVKYMKGIYYIPTTTRFGKSLISVEEVVRKKFISDDTNVYGIYGGLQMQQSFLVTYQVPTSIEVITNNETMWIREIKIKNRLITLRKSRLPINKNNVDAYTILELFNNIDIKKYLSDRSIQREVINFIKEKEIKSKDIYSIAGAFPAKATRNIMESGVLDVLA